MNNMKSTFLFLLTTTMMTCTAYGQSSNHKENKLPDWAFGGFERPKNVNPVISPIENTKFYCPLTKDSIAWESNDTFNPAATLYNGEIVVLYRAEDKSGVGIGHRTSRLGYATSTDGIDDFATVGVFNGIKFIEPCLPILYSISGYKAGIGYRNGDEDIHSHTHKHSHH